jgi:transketolase
MNTEVLANKIRIQTLKMTSRGGSSHIGSIFSIADIVAVLYGKILNVKAEDPDWIERDRFILSKGHSGAAVYAALAECGFIPLEKLETHYQDGSDLSGHVSHKGIPGVELSTGSLGHGLGVGVGMAKVLKMEGGSQKVFVLLSDGECDEGSIWEAMLFAQHHKLDNLVAIIDYNKIQSLASISETIELEPFAEKWRAFNWSVLEVDGHDHALMSSAFQEIPVQKGRPTVMLAHTTKGKGVSFMENTVLWHYRCARGKEFEAALEELETA